MLNLHVIQAEHGDCFILECGTPEDPQYILIDGGPDHIYERHLKNKLSQIKKDGGRLNLAILSHVDADHIIGLLDLMADLQDQKVNDVETTIDIDELWFNSFSNILPKTTNIETRLKTACANAGNTASVLSGSNMLVKSINEGNKLRQMAKGLEIPLNKSFAGGLISLETISDTVTIGDVSLEIVGPTKKKLDGLEKEWREWLDELEESIRSGNPHFAGMSDRSIPNLSSIVLLVEGSGKRILLTGDGRGDHLIQGLEQSGNLNPGEVLHVDVLKLPHHGSDRNVTKDFFKRITADIYIVSANGKHGNPDLSTLIWLVESAQEGGRDIEILVTNETPETKKLVQEYRPEDYGYDRKIMNKNEDVYTLNLDS